LGRARRHGVTGCRKVTIRIRASLSAVSLKPTKNAGFSPLRAAFLTLKKVL
jgi:hypothetical protein